VDWIKSQITKFKFQINLKIQELNPKRVWGIGDWNLGIVCYLLIDAWNFLKSKPQLYKNVPHDFLAY
jgi:hypothetical protein